MMVDAEVVEVEVAVALLVTVLQAKVITTVDDDVYHSPDFRVHPHKSLAEDPRFEMLQQESNQDNSDSSMLVVQCI